MGYWCTLHLFDDKKFYKEVVPVLKGITGDLNQDCLAFLTLHKVGGISHLSQLEINMLVEHTVATIISISNSLDTTFKVNSECNKNIGYESKRSFIDSLDGYYDFCRFLEYYIFKTCSDFFPHVPLGKGGVSRNFDLGIKTLSYSIIEELDSWNEFLCADGMGITNWVSHEDIEYLYLDKENFYFKDNKRAEGFLTLLDIAKNNKLGLIMGVDMREEQLSLFPGNTLVKPEVWASKNTNGLLWRL